MVKIERNSIFFFISFFWEDTKIFFFEKEKNAGQKPLVILIVNYTRMGKQNNLASKISLTLQGFKTLEGLSNLRLNNKYIETGKGIKMIINYVSSDGLTIF